MKLCGKGVKLAHLVQSILEYISVSSAIELNIPLHNLCTFLGNE